MSPDTSAGLVEVKLFLRNGYLIKSVNGVEQELNGLIYNILQEPVSWIRKDITRHEGSNIVEYLEREV